jgi:hypothetical protein
MFKILKIIKLLCSIIFYLEQILIENTIQLSFSLIRYHMFVL